MFKLKIFKRKPKEVVKILPPSVLFALSDNSGLMGKKQILSLIEAGFVSEALYLYVRLKAGFSNPYEMADILEPLLGQAVRGKKELRDYLYQQAHRLGKYDTTTGVKLAQISRQGFDLWYSLYDKKVDEFQQKKINPTIIAFAPLVGIMSFIKLRFFSIIDLGLVESDSEIVGYKVIINHTLLEVKVKFLYKNDKIRGIFLDDTKKTGTKFTKLEGFSKKYGWRFNFECLCNKSLSY